MLKIIGAAIWAGLSIGAVGVGAIDLVGDDANSLRIIGTAVTISCAIASTAIIWMFGRRS